MYIALKPPLNFIFLIQRHLGTYNVFLRHRKDLSQAALEEERAKWIEGAINPRFNCLNYTPKCQGMSFKKPFL